MASHIRGDDFDGSRSYPDVNSALTPASPGAGEAAREEEGCGIHRHPCHQCFAELTAALSREQAARAEVEQAYLDQIAHTDFVRAEYQRRVADRDAALAAAHADGARMDKLSAFVERLRRVVLLAERPATWPDGVEGVEGLDLRACIDGLPDPFAKGSDPATASRAALAKDGGQ